MIVAAIAAAVSALAGLAGGIINKGAANNARIDAANQARVDYERNKTLGVYGLVKNEKQTLLVIIGLGFGLLAFIFYMNKRNG